MLRSRGAGVRGARPALMRAIAAAALVGAAPAAALVGAMPAAAQEPPRPDTVEYTFPPVPPLSLLGNDSAMAAELEGEGVRYDARRAVLYLPEGLLPPERAQALTDSLDTVVAAVEEILGGPHPWQRWRHPRVRYYVYPARFIAHGELGARVFMPGPWLASGEPLPWLHETAHALMITQRDTLFLRPETRRGIGATLAYWLGEGLPNAIAELAHERHGIREYDVFERRPLEPAHAACHRHLATPVGEELLPYLGGVGSPPALRGPERMRVAPAFYACSQSLSRWLVDRHGVPAVAALLNEDDVPAALEALTGMDVEALRREWRAFIAAQAEAAR